MHNYGVRSSHARVLRAQPDFGGAGAAAITSVFDGASWVPLDNEAIDYLGPVKTPWDGSKSNSRRAAPNSNFHPNTDICQF